MQSQKRNSHSTWHEALESEIPPIELSTNPVLRAVLADSIHNPSGIQILSVPEEQIEIQRAFSEADKLDMETAKDTSVSLAMGYILMIQLPSAAVSFMLSPTVEWEIIGGCLLTLVTLKWVASKSSSIAALASAATVANVFIGCLVGEILHFWVETIDKHSELEIAITLTAVLFTVSFYAGLVCDVLYVKRTHSIRFDVVMQDGRLVVTETLKPVQLREKWWITWGLSTSSWWSPLHMLYLLARCTDWLVGNILVSILCDLLCIPKPLRRRR